MENYSTLGHNLKRGIFNFSQKISDGLHKPARKFIAEMLYGLLAAQSSFLTRIARKLNETAALDKTVERLSRNLMNFDNGELLHEQYIQSLEKHFDDSTVLIIDDSDISKAYSHKLEALCRVRDGSTGQTTTGYWYAGVSALTARHKQPIPVYGHLYSSEEEDYKSNPHETLESLRFLSAHFPKTTIRALDRGYDAGHIFKHFIGGKEEEHESFIVRMKDRTLLYKGKEILLKKLAGEFKGKYALNFEAKNGKKANCTISIVPVSLPEHPQVKLNLVICRGLGKEPLLLLTNLDSEDSRLCVTITKVYLMRWRIEEYYRFQKQCFNFEKFMVRSLKSIRNLDLLLSIAIGYIGILSEKIQESIQVHEIIEAANRLNSLSKSKCKFTFYTIALGLFEIFSKLYSGIAHFLQPQPLSNQRAFPGWL
jgi:hypothetical protein